MNSFPLSQVLAAVDDIYPALAGPQNVEVNVLGLQKAEGVRTHIFFYVDAARAALLRHLGVCAAQGEMNDFSWFDAAILSKRIRELADASAARGETPDAGGENAMMHMLVDFSRQDEGLQSFELLYPPECGRSVHTVSPPSIIDTESFDTL